MRKYGVSKKSAEKWAEKVLNDYKQTEEYKIEKEEMDREFKDFILYGKPTTWFNNDTLKDILEYDSVVKTEQLSISEIIERFRDLLTEKELELIKKEQNARN